MKQSAFLLALIVILLPAGAIAAKGDVDPDLDQCSAVMDSKVYISTDFHAYPRDVAFECSYKCNSRGVLQTLKGMTKVRINTMEQDATMTVCQGLVMKTVPWGYDFDKIVPFYAADTEIVSIKKWAFKNINFDPAVNAQEKVKLTKLKQDLYQISSSLIMAGTYGDANSAYVKEAGERISEIADGLPMDTILLDEMIQEIVANKAVAKAAKTAESFIYPVISNAAGWRIPSYLYK